MDGTVFPLDRAVDVTSVSVDGRALARNGAVTLDTNTITAAHCTTRSGAGGGGTTGGGGISGGGGREWMVRPL